MLNDLDLSQSLSQTLARAGETIYSKWVVGRGEYPDPEIERSIFQLPRTTEWLSEQPCGRLAQEELGRDDLGD